MKQNKKFIIWSFLVIIAVFTLVKIYVAIFETNFHDLNITNIEKIEKNLDGKDSFSFAVIGNVENSIDVFDYKLLPLINEKKPDFVIFTGNSIMDGAEDKYGALYKTLGKLASPFILAVGDNEVSDFGAKRFYRHIGPYYFSFATHNTYFIFLDTTGQTSEKWQKEWISSRLEDAKDYQYKFVIMNRPIESIPPKGKKIFSRKDRMCKSYRDFLRQSFATAKVSAVFAAGKGVFSRTEILGVHYFCTGGGGGEISLRKKPFYHFLEVKINSREMDCQVVELAEQSRSTLLQIWKAVWFQIHSWFYVTYINFILFFSITFVIIYTFYSKLAEKVDYYPNINPKKPKKKQLKIAMFTNNYLPFVGGVPIAIHRLKRGLEEQGHQVYLFAPRYTGEDDGEKNVIRCKPFFQYRRKNFEVPVTNIFSTGIKKEFRQIMPDVVHLHHPYWLGSVGLKLAKKYRIATVYTYHTRLEQMNQYLPLFRNLAGGRAPHMLIKHFANSCDAIIAPSKTAKTYLRNLGVGKLIEVLPTGINLDSYRKDPEKLQLLLHDLKKNGKLMLFSVFRLSEEKNPYFLLEGIRQIKENTAIPFTCFIAGDGPEKKKMKKFIRKLELKDTVRLLGNISPEEITLYYQAADIFIFASQAETQGLVILEAMAGGCPVVTIDASGINDIIINGKNGFKTKDNLNEWNMQIIKIMEDKVLRTTMTNNARTFASNFSIEDMAEKVAQLYYQILATK
jgi:glycosyltransferase involved in cell wall biosynthesis